jgi:cytochrome c peroxidase
VSEATYRFRVPSLRNVGLTSPYFHDGSARTLEEAVRVMAKLQLGRTLETREVNEIAAFLRSLSADWSTAETDEINNVMNGKRGKT